MAGWQAFNASGRPSHLRPSHRPLKPRFPIGSSHLLQRPRQPLKLRFPIGSSRLLRRPLKLRHRTGCLNLLQHRRSQNLLRRLCRRLNPRCRTGLRNYPRCLWRPLLRLPPCCLLNPRRRTGFRNLRRSAIEEPSAPAESPDWLARLPPTAAISPVPSEPEAVPSIESEAPDWLAQLSPLAVAPEPELSPVAKPAKPGPALIGEPIPEPEETPAWLADMGSPEPAPAAPVLTEMPDWLKELETKPSPVPSELKTESPSPFAEPVVLPPGEMPAWLQELKPVEAVAPTAGVLAGVPVPPAPGEGGLVAAQLPSWLQGLGPKEPSAVAASQS